MKKDELTNAELTIHLQYIREELNKISVKLDTMTEIFVTKEEFAPVKKLVYGLVGIVLTSVVVAVLALIIKS